MVLHNLMKISHQQLFIWSNVYFKKLMLRLQKKAHLSERNLLHGILKSYSKSNSLLKVLIQTHSSLNSPIKILKLSPL